jgi:hypothetical protein
MNITVFLGPSLNVEQAQAILPARYLPPARMGDVYRAAQQRPDAIAIIDGFFENTAAVWHKEILFAIEQGIPVYGASSMGALRAAELHAFGMRGVGMIFEHYASGAIEDDDEVAVVHAPSADMADSLSEAMVNLRAGLITAHQRGLISEASCVALTNTAKAMFYAERNWPHLLERCAGCGVPDAEAQALRSFVEIERPNQKRDDAIALLTLLASGPVAPQAAPAWRLEHTVYWENVCTYYGTRGAANDERALSFEQLRNHVRLSAPNRAALRRHALLLNLVEAEARRLRLGVPDLRQAMQQFRYRRGLQGAGPLRAWMEAQGLDQEGCLELARLEALELLLAGRLAEQGDHYLERALRMDGSYPQALAAARATWDGMQLAAGAELTEDDVDSVDAALAWYEQRHGRIGVELAQHAADLGFTGKRQFLHELFGAYLADQRGAVAA